MTTVHVHVLLVIFTFTCTSLHFLLLCVVTGDLLNNYCSYDPVANVTRLLFACVIMLTYPIECFVAREVCV